jgi:hypothetical protein
MGFRWGGRLIRSWDWHRQHEDLRHGDWRVGWAVSRREGGLFQGQKGTIRDEREHTVMMTMMTMRRTGFNDEFVQEVHLLSTDGGLTIDFAMGLQLARRLKWVAVQSRVGAESRSPLVFQGQGASRGD